MPAFIGAQGFGAGAGGWRSASASILFVTNLNDSGAGSFREAFVGASVPANQPRYIIFSLGGYIDYVQEMDNTLAPGYSNVYVAGQTAPGGMITFRANLDLGNSPSIKLYGSETCWRFTRHRNSFTNNPSGNNIIFANGVNNIIDHVSAGYTSDDNIGFSYAGAGSTLQWSLLGEGGTLSYNQGMGSFGSGGLMSSHHNYFCHYAGRMPTCDGLHSMEVINLLVYNFGSLLGGGGGSAGLIQNDFSGGPTVNMINNKWKWGPTSGTSTCPPNTIAGETDGSEILHSNSVPANPRGSLYFSGNKALISTGTIDARICSNSGGPPTGLIVTGTRNPMSPAVAITEHLAVDLETVLFSKVGCYLVRDGIDQAEIDSYTALTGNTRNTSHTTTLYGAAHPGAPWPALAAGTALNLQPSGMTQDFIDRMGLANTTASALATTISSNRGLGENYQNIEWNLMEQAGDIPTMGVMNKIYLI